MVAVLSAPPPQLRSMHGDDVPRLAAIEKAAYEFGWGPKIFRDCLRAGHACWVLAQGEEIVGYGVLSARDGEAHILNLCVAPAQHRQGHGRRLLRRLLDSARWYGAERVFLEVRPSNRGAQRLYDAFGFCEIDRQHGYYPARRGREDAIIMALEILPP